MISKSQSFIAVTSEGGLLPSDFLQELLNPKSEVKGLDAKSYDLSEGERVNEQVNRSWNRLKGCWDSFKRSIADKDLLTATTTETRERWLLPLFQELGFGRLKAAKPLEIDGKSYGISHGVQLGGDGKSSGVYVPLHLVGSHVDLDRRTPGAVGAAKASPHSVTQQVLNAREDMLWGMVSNGYILRLLRDNVALTRLSRLDFDLEQIFDGDLYNEFYLLWLVTHRSRFEAERPEQCILEQWKKTAEDKGLRALDNLRPGVEKAIVALGAGLVGHKKNEALRENLRTGALTPQGLYQQVLRVIYRLLFLLVTEDRDLLHPREDSEANRKGRKRYRDFYSITRLRGMTLYRGGTPHPDLWQVLQLVSRKLGSDKGCPELALPALGSFLWTIDTSTPDLKDCLVSNRQVLEAIHALVFVQDGDIRRTVDYKNLGAEELGSVYESLLELHPQINPDVGTFDLKTAAGHERKTTGSYYTPDSLVQCLLDSALEPVVAEAIKGKDGAAAEKAILALNVCDPACGSGHFVIAAAYRLARRLASIRSGGDEPSPDVYRAALRDVISHCIYAVDLNPMAVELCRINLWLESMVPGKPLSFLDHHIRVGNSLLGTTPELVAAGLPDAAFDAIEGDDKKACTALRKRNKGEREGIGGLFVKEDQVNAAVLQQAASALDELPDDRPEDIARKEEAFQQNEHAYDFQARKRLFDAWCAAFFMRKQFRTGSTEPVGITQRHLTDLSRGRGLPVELGAEVDRFASSCQFFHWGLAFPDVFGRGAFDLVLGNPPWERVNIEARQFFSVVRPDIAEAITSKRRALIADLAASAPELFRQFEEAQRQATAEISFFQNAGMYPRLNQARLNTYILFTELTIRICGVDGRVGIIVPSGVATDEGSRNVFGFLVRESRIESLFDFENRQGLFPAVDGRMKFCLLTLRGGRREAPALFAFFLQTRADLKQPGRIYALTARELDLLSPASGLCPTFRSARDRDIVLRMYRRVQSLIQQQKSGCDWSRSDFLIMFRSDDSTHLYKTVEDLSVSQPNSASMSRLEANGVTYLPVWEAKLLHQFDHRFASFAGVSPEECRKGNTVDVVSGEKEDAWIAIPRFWAPLGSIEDVLRQRSWSRRWLVGYRDITNATNERTAIASVLPEGGAAQPLNLFLPESPLHACLWVAAMNSQVLDYIARQRIGGVHLNITACRQLPIVGPASLADDQAGFVRDHVLELVYTSPALDAFAKDCAFSGPPFRWSEERRFWLRAELDAAFFHLYVGAPGEWAKEHAALRDSFPTPRDVVAYIMDTFPIVRRKDEEKYGTYRTKDSILEIYDSMAIAAQQGIAYQSRLDPIPASIRVAHGFDWEKNPLKVPDEPRAAFHVAANYAPTVMIEMLWQNNGVIQWELLKRAWDLLCEPNELAKKAHAELGVAAAKWRKRYCDRLERLDLIDTLSGFCHDGTLAMRQKDGDRVVELRREDRYAFFADVRCDVRLALAVAATLPEVRDERVDAQLAELIALGSR